MASSVSIRDLSLNFGNVKVLQHLDLEVEQGEFIVLLGPSGCGKSTLLNCIAGLLDVSDGQIHITGKNVTWAEPSERGIGMVFQSYALYPHMTVRENMGFALKFAGVPKAEIEKQVQEAAKILELQPLLERRPKELSGGQRQRVAIGRAIVRHPQVFLFDEPLSNLDAELRVHMRIEIAKLHKELQTTIIYVTHDQVEAMTLADKIVVLRGGEIAQVGTPLKLYDDPDNLFVAGFIGSPKMNFLKGQLENGRVVLPEYGNISFPASVSASAPQEVTVGIRPDAFDAGGSEQLPLKVEIVEHLGNETYAYGRLGSGELLTIATDNDRQVKPGDNFVARFNPSSLLLFSEDGQRIR